VNHIRSAPLLFGRQAIEIIQDFFFNGSYDHGQISHLAVEPNSTRLEDTARAFSTARRLPEEPRTTELPYN